MSERGVEEKIRNKYYENKGDYKKIYEAIQTQKNMLTSLGDYFLAAEKISIGFYTDEVMKKLHEELGAYEQAKEAMKLYNLEDNRLQDLFKSDLEKEFRVTNSPKKETLWSKAYERGHSYGLTGIYNVYSDLGELVI